MQNLCSREDFAKKILKKQVYAEFMYGNKNHMKRNILQLFKIIEHILCEKVSNPKNLFCHWGLIQTSIK